MYTVQGNIVCSEHFVSHSFSDNNFNQKIESSSCSNYGAVFTNYIAKNNYNNCITTSDTNACKFTLKCSDPNLCRTFNNTLAADSTGLKNCSTVIDPTQCSMDIMCKKKS
jgi:hypothetical protein